MKPQRHIAVIGVGNDFRHDDGIGWAVLGSVEGRPRRGKLVADILDRVQCKVDKHLHKHLDR